MALLKRNKTMTLVGAPDTPLPVGAIDLIVGRKRLAGSLIVGIRESQEMLDFCAERGITSDVEVIPIQKINEAYERMLKGDVKYRFVVALGFGDRGGRRTGSIPAPSSRVRIAVVTLASRSMRVNDATTPNSLYDSPFGKRPVSTRLEFLRATGSSSRGIPHGVFPILTNSDDVRPERRSIRDDLFAIFPICGFVCAVAAFVVSSPYARTDFPLDDAWIHQVYARSFASGHGFAYNVGTQEAGFTSPLWVVATAPAHWLEPLGGAPAVVLGVKGVGVVLGGIAVFMCCLIAGRLTGSKTSAGIAALFLALEPRLTFAALSGMETVLLVALWMGVTWAVLERRYFTSIVLLGLLPVTRPEAVIIAPVVLAGIAVAGKHCDGLWRRPGTWLCLVLPSVAWAGFCWTVNGRFLPNTFYGKASLHGATPAQAEVAWKILVQQGWGSQPWLWLGLVAFCVWLAGRSGRHHQIIGIVLVLAPILYLFGVLGSRSLVLDGYYWTRWVDPAVLMLTFSQGMGVALLLRPSTWMRGVASHPGRFWSPSGRAVPTLLSALVGIGIVGSLPRWAESFNERRERLASDGRAIYRTNVEPALWIRDNASPDAVVGVFDAGAMRYFGERKTIDLLGLNDADIALKRVNFREAAGQVDWLVMFSFLLDGSGLTDRFVPHAWFRMPKEEYTVCRCPGHTIVVIARRTMPAAKADITPESPAP